MIHSCKLTVCNVIGELKYWGPESIHCHCEEFLLLPLLRDCIDSASLLLSDCILMTSQISILTTKTEVSHGKTRAMHQFAELR